MIGFSHAVFAWFIAVFFVLNPVVVMLFSLVPDADLILNVSHRTILHSLFFVIPFSAFLLFAGRSFALSALAGMLSHLFLDSLTVTGVPLFYPFLTSYFSLFFYNSDSLNWIIIVSCIVIAVNVKKRFEKKYLAFAGVFWFFLLVSFKFLF